MTLGLEGRYPQSAENSIQAKTNGHFAGLVFESLGGEVLGGAVYSDRWQAVHRTTTIGLSAEVEYDGLLSLRPGSYIVRLLGDGTSGRVTVPVMRGQARFIVARSLAKAQHWRSAWIDLQSLPGGVVGRGSLSFSQSRPRHAWLVTFSTVETVGYDRITMCFVAATSPPCEPALSGSGGDHLGVEDVGDRGYLALVTDLGSDPEVRPARPSPVAYINALLVSPHSQAEALVVEGP